jgi:hypothetical protein
MAERESSMTGVALGFIPEPLSVPIASILPSRRTPAGMMNSRKFKQIRSSIEEVGLIEPLSVTPVDQASGNHVLLDGHLRLIALQELQFNTVSCLVATDDESYTYNNRVNRLSTIQEHFMIRRAVERGVSPERLAKALSVDVVAGRRKGAGDGRRNGASRTGGKTRIRTVSRLRFFAVFGNCILRGIWHRFRGAVTVALEDEPVGAVA